jgi:hypothetical protein
LTSVRTSTGDTVPVADVIGRLTVSTIAPADIPARVPAAPGLYA